MKHEHFVEMCDYIDERFHKGWTPEQATVIFKELADFDTSDVWTVLNNLFNAGSQYAPTASVLKARCLDERHKSARADKYRGLPEPRGVPLASSWIEAQGAVSGDDLVRQIHAKQNRCLSTGCDIHYGASA